MSADPIQAHYEQLERIAVRFGNQANHQLRLQNQLRQGVTALRQGGWQGEGGTAFYREMDTTIFPALRNLAQALESARRTTLQISHIMREAEEEAAALFKSQAIGAAVGAAVAGAGALLAGDRDERREDRRSEREDRRLDRRIERDERWRVPPGGRRGGDHLDYDWAGGAILERYLTGGDDWIINNDPRWTAYMQANESLTTQLEERTLNTAQDLWQSGQERMKIDESFPMEIENGEGIVGYQYLHGTNANVGGFQRRGTATVEPDSNGGYVVTLDMSYTWNDVIDPNPQYSTDSWKSRIAEVITLGQADPYTIHITWSERSVVRLDENGEPISIQNG